MAQNQISSGTPDVFPQAGTRLNRDDVEKVIVKNGRGHCWKCDNQLGKLKGRDLLCGNSLLVKRTPMRCGDCGHRNVWTPLVHDRT